MLKFLALAAFAALTSSTSIGCAPGGFNSVNGNYNALIKSNGNRVHGSYNFAGESNGNYIGGNFN